ncbi:MAG: hypothetical protein M3393_05970 [Actinomycetota bacterium]|nr:hypothetical protein [Actinomycetota bacterium]
MSSVTKPKGPLPVRVYWTRRLLALGLVLALVFGISRLFGGSLTDAGTPSARPAAAGIAAQPPVPGPSLSASPTQRPDSDDRPRENKKRERHAKSEKTPLAMPTGPCDGSDVKVVPSVDAKTYAGNDVDISLALSTIESPACSWEVSSKSVVLRVTSGSDPIWTTQDCRDAIPEQPVVVRKDSDTLVKVTWTGQRSDDQCSRFPDWALPGFYYATAAAYGGDPADVQFELVRPVAKTIPSKPEAKSEPESESEKRKRDNSRSDRRSQRQDDRKDEDDKRD